MDVNNVHSNGNFVYDPSIFGYDTTFFADITGAGGTTGTGVSKKIRLNADRIASKVSFRFLDLEMNVNIPAAPTSGDVRSWGLLIPGGGNRARAEFDITGALFKTLLYDNNGVLIGTKTITWDATWSAAEVKYEIVIYRGGVKFFIAGDCVARFEMADFEANALPPDLSQAIHFNNANADNMDIGCIILRNISSWN